MSSHLRSTSCKNYLPVPGSVYATGPNAIQTSMILILKQETDALIHLEYK